MRDNIGKTMLDPKRFIESRNKRLSYDLNKFGDDKHQM
jgi:hypothetical protein